MPLRLLRTDVLCTACPGWLCAPAGRSPVSIRGMQCWECEQTAGYATTVRTQVIVYLLGLMVNNRPISAISLCEKGKINRIRNHHHIKKKDLVLNVQL